MRLGKGRRSPNQGSVSGGRARFQPDTGWRGIPAQAGKTVGRRENHLNQNAFTAEQGLLVVAKVRWP